MPLPAALSDRIKPVVAFFDPVFAVLPQLMVAASAAALLKIHLLPSWAGDWKPVEPAALSLLGGGFFAWISAGATFRKLLREDFTEIVYGPEHLSKRRDIAQLWRNTTIASGLPVSLADLAQDRLLRHIWDPERPYFHEELTRIHALEWIDAAQGTVRVTTQVRGKLVNAVPGREFTRRGKIRSEPNLKFNEVPATVYSRITTTDARTFSAPWIVSKTAEHEYVAEVKLPGDVARFGFDECWTYVQDVDADNVVMFESPVFIRDLTAELCYDARVMTVLIRPIGRFEFEPQPVTPGGHVRDRKRFEDLILPGSGYILTIQRAHAPAAGG